MINDTVIPAQELICINLVVMEDMAKYGMGFARALAAKRMSPAKLADDLGVSPQRITHWKKRGVSAKFAHKVATLLDVDPGAIARLEGADDLRLVEQRADYAASLKKLGMADMLAVFEATRRQLAPRDKLIMAKILIADVEGEL